MRTKFSGFLTLIMAFMVQIGFAQQQTITGTVTDSDNGMPLAGVNIVIEGTNTGTQTDFDGNYNINAEQGQTLVFSYVGYGDTEVTVGTNSVINVDMATSTAELTEVVVVAYGEQERAEITSAISTVNAEEIEQIPIASVDQLLQGRVAGLQASASSGQPGQSGNVIIRGVGTLIGGTDPLYVVDGIVVDPDSFRSMSSNDIASMSVLKDASATALYGNRAANGVILITTKRGKFESPLEVNYRSMFGVSLNTEPGFDVMNAQQYLTYSRDYMQNGAGVGLSDVEIAAIARQTNTNWADIFFRKGTTMSHRLSLTQGTDKSRSYTSFEYFEQEGLTMRSDLQRFNFRSNIDVKASEKFDYSTSLTLNYSKNNFVVDPNRNSLIFGADSNTGGELDNPFIVPYLGLPHFNPYNPDGSLNYVGTVRSGAIDPATGQVIPGGANGFLNTPFLALNTLKFGTDRESELLGIGSVRGNYHFNDNFTLGAQVGVEYLNIESLYIDNPLSHRGLLTPNQNSEFKGQQIEAFIRDFRTNFNPYLKYDDTFGKHSISAGIFMEYIYRNIQTNGSQVYGLDPKLPESGAGFVAGDVTEGANNDTYYYIPNVYAAAEQEHALFSYFGTVDYGYDDRYGISLSVRRDASSRFTKENRWGTFFAAGARWNVTEEEFLKDSETINLLKLRLAYGEVGNESVGSWYQGLRRISSISGYRSAPGYVPAGLTDPNLEWETTIQTNIGIDFGLLDYRLQGSVDLYDKSTKGLFDDRPVSLSSGFSILRTNTAEINNRGVELELAYDIVKNDDWLVNVFANVAYNKNELKGLAPGTNFERGTWTANEVGRPLGSYYLTRWAGVNPANGQPLYYDADGNLTEQYSEDDAVFLDKSMYPTYTGGFGLGVEYKGFRLDGLFSFAAEQYRVNGSFAILEDIAVAATSNQSTTMLDAWQQPGDITGVPALSAGSLRLNLTDRYMEDASFLRLRNITLAYTFDEDMLAKTNLFSSIRVYVQGTNLITWTKWRGFDPETVTGSSSFFEYPTPRQFTTGIDLSF